MKKHLVIALLLAGVLGFQGVAANAAQICGLTARDVTIVGEYSWGDEYTGGSAGLYVRDITSTSVVIDWSGVDFESAILEPNYTLVMYRVSVGGRTFDVPLSQTSCEITGLDSGSYNNITVDLVYNSPGVEEATVFAMCHVTTPGKMDANDASVKDAQQSSTESSVQTGTLPTTQPGSQFYTGVTKLATPTISDCHMEADDIGLTIGYYDPNTEKVEIVVIDESTGKLVKNDISYNRACVVYGLKPNTIYSVQIRLVGSDANYNTIYSDWSSKKYVIAQPAIPTSSKKFILKKNSATIRWNKIKGAKSYVVYARKRYAKKWVKVGTTKKTKFVLKKIKGKKINLGTNNYEITVVAKGKVGEQSVTSYKYEYVYTYSYYKYK